MGLPANSGTGTPAEPNLPVFRSIPNVAVAGMYWVPPDATEGHCELPVRSGVAFVDPHQFSKSCYSLSVGGHFDPCNCGAGKTAGVWTQSRNRSHDYLTKPLYPITFGMTL